MPFDVKILGHTIGTAEGFDTIDTEDCQHLVVQFYGFSPDPKITVLHNLRGMVAIDFVTGEWTVYDKRGTSILASGKISALNGLCSSQRTPSSIRNGHGDTT